MDFIAPSDDDRSQAALHYVLGVFQAEEKAEAELGQETEDEEDEGEDTSDPVERQRRIDVLESISPALDYLRTPPYNLLVQATEKLADSCRDARWRFPMGESGILDSFLATLGTEGVPKPLMIQVLRLIGNACADTDENRQRVVAKGSLSAIAAIMDDESLLDYVLPVLFNICADYEPAQIHAAEAQVTEELIELIDSPSVRTNRAMIDHITRFLEMIAELPREMELAPENTPRALLQLAVAPGFIVELDQFLTLVDTAILYLGHERFQRAAIKSSAVATCYSILVSSCTRFECPPEGQQAGSDSEDRLTRLIAMRKSLTQVLADISALPEFLINFPVTSHLCLSLRDSLSSPQSQVQVTACIMLGNMARSDEVCIKLVEQYQVHEPLIKIITEANDSQLLHAALGFLKNLALPLTNKLPLGDAGLLAVLPRLWAMDTLPQIQYSAVSLARQLLTKQAFENVRRICQPLNEGADTSNEHHTRLAILISLFQKSDAEPVKMEMARLIVAVARTYENHYPNIKDIKQQMDIERQKKQLYQGHPDVARPLAYMVVQKKWPALRSEGWFAMAAMCHTPQGAACVARIMDDSVFQLLTELFPDKPFVDGRKPDSPATESGTPVEGLLDQVSLQDSKGTDEAADLAQPNTSSIGLPARHDRDNALTLAAGLLRHCGSGLPLNQSSAMAAWLSRPSI